MIDTHAHINIKPHKDNLESIVLNAKNNHVNKILSIGMDYETSLISLKQAISYNNIYATLGIHPGYVKGSDHNLLDEFYNNPKVVAVGEIGIDLYHTTETKDLQIKIFEEQVLKAIKLNLPVIIHTRNSFTEIYEIVKKYKGELKGVFHCFSSNLEDAKKAVELGFYIGLDGPITFKNKNEELQKIAKEIALDKILIETDSPFLSPEPKRGRTNEPANLLYIAKKLAELRRISLEEVIRVTTNNAKKLFGI